MTGRADVFSKRREGELYDEMRSLPIRMKDRRDLYADLEVRWSSWTDYQPYSLVYPRLQLKTVIYSNCLMSLHRQFMTTLVSFKRRRKSSGYHFSAFAFTSKCSNTN